MAKPLHQIIKYHLCSEHFADDCFHDPLTRSQLKIDTRNFKIPLPSIFKSNINHYMRGATTGLKENDDNAMTIPISLWKAPEKVHQRPRKESPEMTLTKETPEDSLFVTTPIGGIEDVGHSVPDTLLTGQHESVDEILSPDEHSDEVSAVGTESDDCQIIEVYQDETEEVEEERIVDQDEDMIVLVEEPETEIEVEAREAREKVYSSTCRLCGELFASVDGLIKIYAGDKSLAEGLHMLMPDSVSFRVGQHLFLLTNACRNC